MKYKSVAATGKGGPEVLSIIENESHQVQGEEVFIKVLSCGVGYTDVAMRYWRYPGVPNFPFVPGYEIVGQVEAIGENVTKVKVGDIVGALTVYGGYSEYIYLGQDHLVRLPDSLEPCEAAAVILNYTAAWQMLRRVAQVKAGDRVLVTGASGGVGTALLDLGKMENLILYGTASANKHQALNRFGACLIDYKTCDFADVIKKKEPQGLDYAFDSVGGAFIKKSYETLHRDGLLVNYSFNLKSFSNIMKTMFDMMSGIPQGKKGKGYGIAANYKLDKKPILDDIAAIFDLLAAGKIKPLIAERLPLLEAQKANQLLESGNIVGKIVLL